MGTDPRFFDRLGPLSAGGLAEKLGLSCIGDPSALIEDAAEPASIGEGQLCFLSKGPNEGGYVAGGGVVIVPSQSAAEAVSGASAVLIAKDPKSAFTKIVSLLTHLRVHDGDMLIHNSAQIDGSATVAPGAIIGQDAVIGANTAIGAGAVIGPGVVVGENCRIGPRAILQCAIIGNRCEIYAGAILGEAGFGLSVDDGGLIAIPHVGRVILKDEVTIGANSTIDRGMIRDTILHRGVKIDNLCHVAHNCEIGANTVMAAFAGISGSVVVGEGVQFGGRAGVADHLTIGDGARIAADAAIMRDIPAGEFWAGSPAQPIRSFMRETAWIRRQVHSKGSKQKKD